MAATSTGMTRLESFPFDSKADGYDADGYPIYDRAVGASMLRDVFAKFFTNGIFPNPGTALQLGKADTGLAVTIQPGIGIINGSMGGVREDAITVTLDTAAPQGNVAYAVMLRYDNTDGFADSRSLLINVVKSDAASTPTPPAPDTTTPEVFELRLGYVVVPSGATDLSGATVHNDKGLEVCPFAAPFEEIDVSGIVSDFQVAANEALTDLLAYYDANKETIEAALDGTAATHLQNQINALQEELENFNLSGSVDNETIEYAAAAGEASAKLRVKDGGISDDQIASGKSLVPLTGTAGQVLARTDGGVGWETIDTSSFDLLFEGSIAYNANSVTISGFSKYDNFLILMQGEKTAGVTLLASFLARKTVAGSENLSFGCSDVCFISLSGTSSDNRIERMPQGIVFGVSSVVDTVSARTGDQTSGSTRYMFYRSDGSSTDFMNMHIVKIWGVS